MTTALELFPQYVSRLQQAGVFSPEGNVRKIIAHVCEIKDEVEFSLGFLVTEDQHRKLEEYVGRREKREPLARIFGVIDYANVRISVEPNVFRPLPETEVLIEYVLDLYKDNTGPLTILDLGTGSGCLLLSLLNNLPQATGVGIDIDQNAVNAATENAVRNNLSGRSVFQTGNWGDGQDRTFDIVVCNPPAAASRNVSMMLPEMRAYDPLVSLDGGADGLDFFRYMAQNFERLVAKGGIGAFQAYSVSHEASIFQKKGHETEIKRNFAGRPTCLIVRHGNARKRLFGFLRW